MTVMVEVIQDKAFNLLSNMECLDLIRLSAPINNTAETGEKLSDRFAGTLHLSDETYKEYQNALQEGRNEWRNIY